MTNNINDKKWVVLTFYRKDLLYDIGNIAYVSSDVMEDGVNHEQHQIADIIEDGNVDRVTRVIDLSFQECVDTLYAYSKSEVEDESRMDNQFGESDKYTMNLYVPKSTSKGTISLLENLIHEYIVQRVLYDWFGITGQRNDKSAMWGAKSIDTKEKIALCMNLRTNRVRRKLSPF